MIDPMSEDRLRFIEVIGADPATASTGREESQRAAFQAARRSAEVLAEEAGLRLTGVQQIAETSEDGDPAGPSRVRLRVRFGIEPARSMGGRAGFQATE
jgi:uncharacterized protein YggE